MKSLKEVLGSLPRDRRAKIKARAEALILEEMTLRQAREVAKRTQTDVAKQLKIGQDSISRLEQRDDMLLSTLRQFVAAIGGRVRVVVEFDDRPSVELKKLGKARKRNTKRAA